MRRVALALGLLAACRSAPPAQESAPATSSATPVPDDVALAREWLAASRLPVRAEVVALTDRLAIASTKDGRSPRAAESAWLAAQLRERAWRVDHVASDAREALELYTAAADRAPDRAVSCDAELRRALLAGEVEQDGAAAFRDLYVAFERQGAVSAPNSPCVERLKGLVEGASAFRPTGQAWMDLQEQARREAESAVSSAPLPVARAGASSPAPELMDPPPTSAESTPPTPPLGDVVIRPDDAMIRSRTVELREVKPYSWPGGGRVVLSLSGPVKYDVGVLAPDSNAARGHRVFLDLAGAKPRGGKLEFTADGVVSAVRLGKRDEGTRVVIDLREQAHHRVFYLPEPFRVVIDLSTRETAAIEQPKTGRKRVTRVTLDPGHGGWDAGATGPTGLREKDVALDVAHRAAPALASELGIETMLTRDTDVFVPLEERTARANAFHSDLFVSVHCNATEDGHADGIEIYMLDPTRQMDATTVRAVARENHNAKERARAKALDPKMLDAQMASIAAGLNVADTTIHSRTFAKLLQTSAMSSLARYGKVTDHGVKTAAFFVLVGAEMPATLFETSFISNPTDEARLGTADYRQKLADAIVNAIRAYRDGLGTAR
ncbi:MAG: N-acetylmuramoyl-L-alanine amidase [Deltaproteobacteria bacterium]|nr:N-acetylmuramoyl-L-alanine amidase [Deltaproteobacteria bacterium]